MASATVRYGKPVTPPVEGINLNLSVEEANALLSVLCTVAVKGPGKVTYKIFSALMDNAGELEVTPLTPFVPNKNYGVDLVEFKEA